MQVVAQASVCCLRHGGDECKGQDSVFAELLGCNNLYRVLAVLFFLQLRLNPAESAGNLLYSRQRVI